MPIKRGAIETLRTHTRGDATKGFERALFNAKNPNDPKDVDPGQPRWDRDGNFILSCCQTIGSIAAADAKSQGAVVINTQILMNAYQKVRVANSPPVPGEYCPA
jgi:hypothetical protein